MNSSNPSQKLAEDPTFGQIRTGILVLNLAIFLVQLPMSLLNFGTLLFRNSIIHPNLKFIFLSQSFCFCCYAFGRICQTITIFQLGPDHLFDGPTIQFMILFGAMFNNFIGHALIVERVLATLAARKYEQWKGPWFSLAWFMPLFLFTGFNSYEQMVLLTDHDPKNDNNLMVSTGSAISIFASVALSLVEILAMTTLGTYNLKRYKAWLNHYQNRHNLSERYQLAENIRTAHQLAPVLTLHFINICMSLPGLIIIYYNLSTNPTVIGASIYFYFLCISFNNVIIELVMISRFPALRKNPIASKCEALISALMPFCRWRNNNRVTDRFTVSRTEYPRRTTIMIANEQCAETERHFRFLRQIWKVEVEYCREQMEMEKF